MSEFTPPPSPQPRLRKLPRKLVLGAILLALLIVVAIVMMRRGHVTAPASSQTQSQASAASDSPGTIRLMATGDWIAHDSVNAAALQSNGSYNYLPQVQDIMPVFQKADIRFCNDPILNGGKALGITGYPKFNSPTDFVTDMGKFGCNLVNTASNHSFDFTQANISASVAAWKSVPTTLAVAGENSSQAEHDAVHYFTVKGVKFAFLAYTTYSNTDAPTQNDYGVNIFTKAFASSQIAAAKQHGAQVIIASMRWGTEYSQTVDADQTQAAQFLADQGVSIVLGHGSHELQAVQQLTGTGGNKTLVWYSLGNFLNTQEPAETLFNGLAVMDIDTKTKQVSIKGYLPIYMHYTWTAAQAKADDTNSRANLHMYLLDDTTQAMLDSQQLNTSVAAQKARMTATLAEDGVAVPFLSAAQLR